MTREEALNDWLPIIRQMAKGTKVYEEALEMAIKALEQEPCEDAISRQAAINAAIEAADEWDGGGNRNREEIIAKALEQLPSVTPMPKMGKWERMSGLSEDMDDRYKCSKCGNVVHSTDRINLYTFHRWCGRCGSNNDIAKMQEVAE